MDSHRQKNGGAPEGFGPRGKIILSRPDKIRSEFGTAVL